MDSSNGEREGEKGELLMFVWAFLNVFFLF